MSAKISQHVRARACACLRAGRGARGEGRGARGEGRGVRTQHASTACKLDVDTLFDTLFEASALSQTPPRPRAFSLSKEGEDRRAQTGADGRGEAQTGADGRRRA